MPKFIGELLPKGNLAELSIMTPNDNFILRQTNAY